MQGPTPPDRAHQERGHRKEDFACDASAQRGTQAPPRAPAANIPPGNRGRRRLGQLIKATSAGMRWRGLCPVVETGPCRPSAGSRSPLANPAVARRRPCRPAAGEFSDAERTNLKGLGTRGRGPPSFGQPCDPLVLTAQARSAGAFPTARLAGTATIGLGSRHAQVARVKVRLVRAVRRGIRTTGLVVDSATRRNTA